jgi:hypothetical protein
MSSTVGARDLLAQLVRAWCRDHLRVDSVEEAEPEAVALMRQVGEVIVAEGVQQTDGKASYEGCSVACECGQRAKFKAYRKRWVTTLAGPVRVARAYYYCRHCHQGQSPWDRRQGLSQRQWTAGVKSLLCNFAGRLTYGDTVELLELSTGLRVEGFSAEQIVASVGQQLRSLSADQQAAILAGEVGPAPAEPPGRLYVAMDGTHAHIDGGWHEVKTAAIYGAVTGKEGLDTATATEYLAAQETAEVFAEGVYCAAVARASEQADETVVLGDGADWIWSQSAHHFPRATEIVDYWHACEHLWNLRRALYATESKAGDRWAHEHCQRLLAHGPGSLRRALQRLKPTTPEAGEALRLESGYFAKHQHRMSYPQYRARGLMIGSGPVEAACKRVVGDRLKRAGMRWSAPGADAVLAVRCALLNKQTDLLTKAAKAAA